MTIAKQISDQIGGRAFFMMGAKQLTDIGDGLRFKVGRGARNKSGAVTHVTVTLDAAQDLYNIRFEYVRGLKVTPRATHDGIFCDMLHEIISAETGMALSL